MDSTGTCLTKVVCTGDNLTMCNTTFCITGDASKCFPGSCANGFGDNGTVGFCKACSKPNASECAADFTVSTNCNATYSVISGICCLDSNTCLTCLENGTCATCNGTKIVDSNGACNEPPANITCTGDNLTNCKTT